jgi:flagellar motor switch protein FliN/FliY
MADDALDAEWAAALDEQRTTEENISSGDAQTENSDGMMDEWANAMEESGDIESENNQPQDDMMDVDWAAALEEQQAEEGISTPPEARENTTAIQSKPKSPKGIQILLKIPLEISVSLGETRMFINDLMQLGQGSIIELNKIAGADMDLLVNGKYLGRGEVVVVNEHFGIRINHIASPEERIKSLGQGGRRPLGKSM